MLEFFFKVLYYSFFLFKILPQKNKKGKVPSLSHWKLLDETLSLHRNW